MRGIAKKRNGALPKRATEALPKRATLEELKATLSPRQAQIMRLICSGWVIKEIATEKGIAVESVKFHLRRAKSRLNARTTAQAAVIFYSLQAYPKR